MGRINKEKLEYLQEQFLSRASAAGKTFAGRMTETKDKPIKSNETYTYGDKCQVQIAINDLKTILAQIVKEIK